MKNMIPVVMAGVLGIYGLIVSVIITQKITFGDYQKFLGYAHLASGMAAVSAHSVLGLLLASSEMLEYGQMLNSRNSL